MTLCKKSSNPALAGPPSLTRKNANINFNKKEDVFGYTLFVYSYLIRNS
jgi:hypothetical protein